MKKAIQASISFFAVFCYQIAHIFWANIFFVLYFILQLINDGRLILIGGKKAVFFLYLFLIYITIDTIWYSIFIKTIELRSIPQFLYNFQYLFLIVLVKIDFKYLEKVLIVFATSLSIFLSVYFFISGDSLDLYKWNVFINSYLGGWPNTLPLILIFVLFLNRNFKYPKYVSAILIFALLITGSRGGFLGGLAVLLLPIFRRMKRYTKIIIFSIVGILVIFFNVLINLESEISLFRSFDRVDIFYTSMDYIKQSLFFGYGGNTIDQLSYVKIDYDPIMDWPHTHNFVLEFALRYGLIGLTLFLLFIYYKIQEIREFDLRYLFFIFMILAFFQTFMRDFIFLFVLIFISQTSFNSLKDTE